MSTKYSIHLILSGALCLAIGGCDEPDDGADYELRDGKQGKGKGKGPHKPPKHNEASYNLHLERTVRFHTIQPGADADRGRRLFGLAADMESEDTTEALFEGVSVAANGKNIVSNGRSCFTCHRGLSEQLGLPPPPLSDHVPLTDPLFTGLDADAQGDPDGFHNLDQLGLIKYRPNRFDPRTPPDNPFKRAFGWRKSMPLQNTGLQQGFLNDLRGRTMFETARGAVFSHTQAEDDRFDDLFTLEDGNDIEAFIFSQFTDPVLAALRNENDPMYHVLVNDPFYTVPVETKEQKRGQKVFEKYCFGACHNTPQIFSSLDNVEPLGAGDRPPNFPSWAPAVGRTYNVGIAERNAHGLRFTHYNGPGANPEFETIVIPLANEDGSINMHEIEFDLGLALITGRSQDIGRFKVPQLRNLSAVGPYFHDNTAATIEEVVDYFTSDDYNSSQDGQNYPIHLSAKEKADLIEFLKIL